MTIKEQIEIARMIASGTPREVAIREDKFRGVITDKQKRKIPGDAIDVKNLNKGEITPQDKAKARVEKVRQAVRRKPQRRIRTNPDLENTPLRRTTRTVIGKVKKDKAEINPISYSGGGGLTKVTKDEGDATALQSQIGNLTKVGVRGTKNILKTGVKAVNLAKRLGGAKVRKEEFIQEVEKKEKSGTKKVIDIMRGKNSIKVNPDMKEDTVVVQDASGKDFVEVVDIVSPSKVRSDWRKEINVTEASAAWTRKAGKNKSGGLNEKGRKSYERENPGSDLKAPSKKVGNPRRASFCARMKGMKKRLTSAKTARDPDSRINKSLRKWNC